MGRTPIPLTIWTTPEWASRPEMLELAEKGHTIVPISCDADLLLHPAAHCWTEPMWETRLLDVALSAARKRRPPREPAKKKGKKGA